MTQEYPHGQAGEGRAAPPMWPGHDGHAGSGSEPRDGHDGGRHGGHGHGRSHGQRGGPGDVPGPFGWGRGDVAEGDARRDRLTRSRRHKVIGGVCGGLGRYFDLDPVIFRISLAVLSVIGGVGFIAYGVAWLLLPFEDDSENEGRRMLSGRVDGPGLSALLLVVVGFGLLLASLPGRSQSFSVMLLAALIGAAYWSRHRRGLDGSWTAGGPPDAATAQAVASAPPEVQAPPAPATASWWRTGGSDAREGYLWGPTGYDGSDLPPRVDLGKGPGGGDPFRPPGARTEPPLEPRREFWLGGPVLLLAVVAAVIVGALSWDRTTLSTALVYSGSAAVAVFGLGLVVGAFWGRLGIGTTLGAVLATAATLAAATLPASITTQWTEERWTPTAVSEIEPEYELGSGRATLDLAGLELADGERAEASVRVGGGQVRVFVPNDVTVEVVSDIWLGGYTFGDPAERDRGPSARIQGGGFRADWVGTYGPTPGIDSRGVIALNLSVGVGHIEINRMPPPEQGPHPADEEQREQGEDSEPVEAAATVGVLAPSPEGEAQVVVR
ncbi:MULTISPECIES: PspC domain-containing protein [unclassified Streptomyces]|uniref:PspC domain-containing protein n=1 Tax=unclassified Streptomyces TaxID=2593676 RepID=UPI0015E186AA|nr:MULTISPECIES: PspC domain-containing protein [unclassified Streptomyces]